MLVGIHSAGGSLNVRASVLTNVAASAPGEKSIFTVRTRFCGSVDPHEK